MKQIWAKALRDEMNIALFFSYNVQATESTVLRLASNVPFRVWINGELFSYGPRRKAHGYAAINEYSLKDYAGQDAQIDVECVSYRVGNFYIVNQPPFFAGEIEENGEIVADSFAFKAYRNLSKLQKVQRFAYQRGFIEAYNIDGKLTLSPVEVDEQSICKLGESSAPYPKFTLLQAEEFECGKVFEKTTFEEFNDASYNRRGTRHFAREEQEYRISLENDKYGFEKTDSVDDELCRTYKAYRFPKDATGFLAFDIEVTEDADVMINYDEKISPTNYRYVDRYKSDDRKEDRNAVDRTQTFLGGACNIDVHRLHSISLINYKLSKGKYSLTAFEPDAMQYVRIYLIKGKAKISNVRLITYENEEVKLQFSCEDEDLNLIFQSAINTFKANAVDVLTDCSSRERAGWLCDTYFSGRAEKIITGSNAVEKNTIECFRDYRSENCPCVPEGLLPMCYPSDHTSQGEYIHNWCMWFVLEVESYLQRTGDRKLVDELKEKLCAVADYELRFMNNDGLLEDITGWVFVEWSKANTLVDGVNYPTNMLFSAVLKTLSRMYGEEKYAKIAERMDEQIVKQSFNGKFFVDNAKRDEKGVLKRNTEWTETCQYYAFWFGYASKEEYPELFEIIFNEIHDYTDLSDKYPVMWRSDSFIGLYLRLDYLSRIRENEKVIRDLKNFFLFQAKETKTLWEYKTPTASCCHAFASLMCEWIVKAVLGVESVDEKGVTFKGDGVNIKATAKIPYLDKLFTV
ncbi:MAG: hypothetical protein E7381_05350 [Clostridiales bacterium]|nr:hypothetical protein [Clostridiales bacterium]